MPLSDAADAADAAERYSSSPRLLALQLAGLEQTPRLQIPSVLAELAKTQTLLLARLVAESSAEATATHKPVTDEGLLTANEVANRFGVSVRWVYRHSKDLGSIRLSENRVRFPETGVRRFLKRRVE